MEQQDYHCSITVPIAAKAAFEGICNVSGWWAKNLEGKSQSLNDVFTVHFGETFGTFKIIELIQDKKIVWLTTDSYLDLLKNKTEWKDTKIVWEISSAGDSTRIDMTHIGLVPGIECFNDCFNGWNFFIKESLYEFLTGKKGQPGTGIRATVANGDRVYKGTLFSKNDPAPDFPDGYIFADVKETQVEHVLSAYAIDKYDKTKFDTQKLKGDHFMIIENKPLYNGIHPLEDLAVIIK